MLHLAPLVIVAGAAVIVGICVCRDRLLADDGWLTKPLAKLILYGLITMLSTVLAYKLVGVDATTGLVLLVVFAVLGLYVFAPIGTECDNLKIPQKSGHALVLLIIVVVLVVSVAWLFICREGLLCVTPPTTEYWVRQMADPARLNASAPAFPVAVPNGHMDIAHLKKVIKAEAPSTVTCDAFQLHIYKQGADGTWMEQIRPDTALVPSSVDVPYGFVIP